MNELLSRILSIRHVEQWINRSATPTVITIGILIGVLAAVYLSNILLVIPVILLSMVLCLVSRHIIREIYLRTGHGAKIGIAYDGHGVPLDDWLRAKRKLRGLLRDNSAEPIASIRILPRHVVESDRARSRTIRRYGLALLVEARWCKKIETDQPTSTFKIQCPGIQSLERELRDRILIDFGNIPNRTEGATDTIDRLDRIATGLYERVLLLLGAHFMSKTLYDDGYICLCTLDNQLSGISAIGESPRRNIREKAVYCMLFPALFDNANPPGPDGIDKANAICIKAINIYGIEFPFLYNLHARVRFFAGDVDGALDLVNQGLAHNLEPLPETHAILNLGVLELFRANWDQAHKHLSNFLARGNLSQMPWDSLIEFSLYAISHGYYSAKYLYAFYMLCTGSAIPPEKRSDVVQWLDEDTSRRGLKELLNRATLIKTSGGALSTPKVRPKIKRRKKKRRRRNR